MRLLKILKDQGGQFWGGFLGGLNRGIEEQRKHGLERERLESQKKLYDLQLKQHDLQTKIGEQNLRDKIAKSKSIEDLAVNFETGTPGQASPDISFETAKDEPQFTKPDDIGLRERIIGMGTPATGGDPRRAAMIRAGFGDKALSAQPKSLMEQFTEMQAFQKAAGGQTQSPPQAQASPTPAQNPPEVRFSPTGRGYIVPPGSEKTPFRADDALYRSLLKKHGGDFEAARAEYDKARGATAKAGSAGS